MHVKYSMCNSTVMYVPSIHICACVFCFWPVSLISRVGWLTIHGLIEIIKGQTDTPLWVRLMCFNVNQSSFRPRCACHPHSALSTTHLTSEWLEASHCMPCTFNMGKRYFYAFMACFTVMHDEETAKDACSATARDSRVYFKIGKLIKTRKSTL